MFSDIVGCFVLRIILGIMGQEFLERMIGNFKSIIYLNLNITQNMHYREKIHT